MEMAEKVEKDPSDKLSKVHNDIMQDLNVWIE